MRVTIPVKDQQMNGAQLAFALGHGSTWVIKAIKKANRQLAQAGAEELIFSGRYSTPAKVLKWLEAHSDFLAADVLAPNRKQRKKNAKLQKPKNRRRGLDFRRLETAWKATDSASRDAFLIWIKTTREGATN